jgi:hypothetical protein
MEHELKSEGENDNQSNGFSFRVQRSEFIVS